MDLPCTAQDRLDAAASHPNSLTELRRTLPAAQTANFTAVVDPLLWVVAS